MPSAPRQAAQIAPVIVSGLYRVPVDVEQNSPLARDLLTALRYRLAKDPDVATTDDWLHAAIFVVRDRIVDRWIETTKQAYAEDRKRVYYLSLEFLIGRLTRDAFSNLGLLDDLRNACAELGVDLHAALELEPDAALGNGGLGRLAACFMESMATVDVPAFGYGIRYVNGMFRQEIADGAQVELPETWLDHGNPWEFERRERSFTVGFGGSVVPRSSTSADAADADAAASGPSTASTVAPPDDTAAQVWHPDDMVEAVAYDTPVVGWRGNRVNSLRLWSAVPVDPILLDRFNAGDHVGALEESNRAEALSRVLYPADSHKAGQELRLRQEYFFSSASLQDIIHRHLSRFPTLDNLADQAAIQLNDTHPAVVIAELMRLLIDVHEIPFDRAWEITTATCSYTNHTLLPEALESWPVELFEQLLPRHLQLIYAINARMLDQAFAAGLDGEAVRAVSLIGEDGARRVRMGNLAFVGSHSINGVSALHTDLMKETIFRDLDRLYPGRINNKTNGVTPRRWVFEANAGLTSLLTETIGDRFLDDFSAIGDLDQLATDGGFVDRFAGVKAANKQRLAVWCEARTGVVLHPEAIFDIHIKRIHEYKRQLLNVLHAVDLYRRIKDDPHVDVPPRVKLFGGKAAPSYYNAKLIIRLINDVAAVINNDPAVGDRLKVVFVPNYNVSAAEVMIPAADLSEQISTAGLEASGTGNMKFAMNGAITIGTLDGANVEMREHVGDDNIVIFGLAAEEVAQRKAQGYDPASVIAQSTALATALGWVSSGVFSPSDPGRYRQLIDGVYHGDWFMVAADFDAYLAAQRRVEELWRDRARWNEIAIRNTARMSWFSSDRTITQYNDDIWHT